MLQGATQALPGFREGASSGGRQEDSRVELDDGFAAELLCGDHAILRHAERIDEFISLCGDAGAWGGAMVWLRDAMAQSGIPCIVLLHLGDALVGAAAGWELTLRGRRTRLAICGNLTGQRGFFMAANAGRQERDRAARAAADAMMASGIMMLMFSLKEREAQPPKSADRKAGCSAVRVSAQSAVAALAQREVYDTFDLGASFDESLSHLGAHTRRNLRYYRRCAERELQCEFLSCMEGQLLRQALVELQFCTDDPALPGVAKNRLAQVARNPQAFCMGLRATDGRWLSWVSGWRTGRSTYIDWQCNRSGMARLSLSTVMRSYLIEHEGLLRQDHIRFLGGTPHTMHYGFREELCTDWLIVRRGPWAAMLRSAAPGLRLARRLAKRGDAGRASGHAKHKAASHRTPVLQLLKRMAGVLMK